MTGFCDLHNHSVFSDGTETPTQLLDRAEALGLAAIALTDHNTVAGLPEFLAAAEGRSVWAIPGTEFSTDWHGTELHILGLFLKPEHFSGITELLEDYTRRKDQSNVELVERLNKAGYAISYEKIKAATPNGQVNRALIAAELMAAGCVPTIQAAFDNLLQPKHGYFVPPTRPEPCEIIRLIKSMGAVAVLAHPFLNLKEDALRVFLSEAAPAGLDAMEIRYSTYDAETTRKAAVIAAEYGLLPSGGSDYHGGNKPHIAMGSGTGELSIPVVWANDLLARTSK
jgi:predicted metal-dependent phosphoesterase TrpH